MTPEVANAVRSARVEFAFQGQPASLGSSLLLSIVTCVVLWPSTDHRVLSGWWLTFTAVTAARFALYRGYRRAPQAISSHGWQRRFTIGALLAGMTWGLSCVLIFPDNPRLQMFLAFVLAGIAAGAVTAMSAVRTAALSFVLMSTLPLAVQLLLAGGEINIAMSIMVFLFLIMVSSSVTRLHAQLQAVVTSRLQADAHLQAFTAAQQDMQLLNDRLLLATRAGKIGIWEWNLISCAVTWDSYLYLLYDVVPNGPYVNYEVWRQRLHPQDIARIERMLADAIRGDGNFDTEYRILHGDGCERVIKSAALVQRNSDGVATRMIGMSTDITDLRRVERMKGEFVSIVSHELRTPLTSIRAALGLVANGAAGSLPAKAHQMLTLASRNAERLGVLIDDILDMEKIESGKLRFELVRQPLLPLLRQSIAANLAYAAMHKVELHLLTGQSAEDVTVDGMRVLQIMTNLISNAAKFSPAQSRIDISTQRQPQHVRVLVRDRGPGIAPEFQSRIFGKFCQGDASDTRAKGGSGLGLAISRAIVEQMGGGIGFTTGSDGTTFYFDLPLSENDTADASERTTIVLPHVLLSAVSAR